MDKPQIRNSKLQTGLRGFRFGIWGLGFGFCLACGCGTPRPKVDASPPPDLGALAGEVIRVNAASGYVVIACAALLSAGEEANVYRQNRVVGRLRVTPPGGKTFVTADIVQGQVQRGDKVRRGSSPPQQAGKP